MVVSEGWNWLFARVLEKRSVLAGSGSAVVSCTSMYVTFGCESKQGRVEGKEECKRSVQASFDRKRLLWVIR